LLEVVLRLTDVATRERRAAQERQELLIAELNHRVRNILALIRGLITRSRERAMSLEEFASVVGGRVQALARAHDQITVDNWGPAPLRNLFTTEAGAYLHEKANRVSLDGPDVLLEPPAFSTLALVVHELLTNSAKYGALCDNEGKVRVTWEMSASGRLVIDWQEEGGPPVQAPTRRGFGSTIIERSIPFDLKGEADVQYRFEGVKARFEIPSGYVRRDPHARRAAPAETAHPVGRVLCGAAMVVEDNMIIALDAEALLAELGADTVETASSVADALRRIAERKLAFAIVDVNLGHESSFPVADALMENGVPFAFATGYGKNIDFPERFAHVPVIAKPYALESVASRIEEARAAVNRGASGTSPPRS
jgi:two-component sensor histidine kinase/CheY-like chemotaxis protein